MAMVFCRGCGKELHQTAPTCPHCGAPQNISSRASSSTPDGIKGWSWGAFLFNWIWAIGNKTWIGLFAIIPYVGIIMAIILGFKGREWAWKNKQWESVEHFNRVQRKWSVWGGALIGGIAVIGILAAIAIPAYSGYQHKAVAAKLAQQQALERKGEQEKIQNQVQQSTSNTYTDTELAELASQTNATLPMMVDKETRLDSTVGKSNMFIYNYTLITTLASSISEQVLKNALENNLIQKVCTTKEIIDTFLNKGVTVSYRYYGKDGGLIGDISIAPSQCGGIS